ncbi:MAG: hypothetical protein ACKOEH_12375, partial [Actinomycetota bacterium]
QIPIESDVASGGDNGEPVAISGGGQAAEVFRDIAKKIISQTVPANEMAGCSARMLEAVTLTLGPKPAKRARG